MKMNKITLILKFLLGSILLGGIIYGVNLLFPLTFTPYFILCGLSLLICLFMQRTNREAFNRAKLFIPWLITTTLSIVVTYNYLNPKDVEVYSNADYHVLGLKGVTSKSPLQLVSSENRGQSLFDSKDFNGKITVEKSGEEGDKFNLNYSTTSLPIYLCKEKGDSLINGHLLPSFKQNVSFEDDSIRCDIHILSYSKGAIGFEVSFTNEPDTIFRSLFSRKIEKGYNLYDAIHSGLTFSVDQESIINNLRNAYLLKTDSVYYITLSPEIERTRIYCDNLPFVFNNKSNGNYFFGSNDYFKIGIGSTQTKEFSISNQSSDSLSLTYKFPYLFNFPKITDDDNFGDDKKELHKIITIASTNDALIKSDVIDAFFYNLFNDNNRSFPFSGVITYRVADNSVPFNASIIDDMEYDKNNQNVLLSSNGSKWQFEIYNLREGNVLGNSLLWPTSKTIIFLLLAFSFIGFLISQIAYKNSLMSGMQMMVWLFVLPMITMRLYLLWRIAVFPPVSEISYEQFLRYRMENSDNSAFINTLKALSILIILTIVSVLRDRNIILNKTNFLDHTSWVKAFVVIDLIITIICLMAVNSVLGHIVLPMTVFLINEYLALKCLDYRWRVASVIVIFGCIFKGDAGYAVMLLIFLCVYYIIQIYSFQLSKSKDNLSKAQSVVIWILLFAILTLILTFASEIVCVAFDNNRIFTDFEFTYSHLFFLSISLVVGLTISAICKMAKYNKSAFFAICLVPIFFIGITILGQNILSKNQHIRYRALVHTQTVGDLMNDLDYSDPEQNNRRLLEASQNQWFIQYYNNVGDSIAHNGKIMTLAPHFKKGVNWGTQISDVVVSRYLVGEISHYIPGAIVAFALCFLLFFFYSRNSSYSSKSINIAIALLIVIQMTFVWMAATNRMIFFGQDFPFLSQNATSTLFMFFILLGTLLVLYTPQSNLDEKSGYLLTGIDHFSKKHGLKFIGIYCIIFILVGIFGNKYNKIYDNGDGGNSSNATEYNLSQTMERCSQDLHYINDHYLSRFNDDNNLVLHNNQDLRKTVEEIEKELDLTANLERDYNEKRISKFTFSLYNAFHNRLCTNNSLINIIHLKKNKSTGGFEFALNNGFYSIKNPGYYKKSWRGHIYSYKSQEVRNKKQRVNRTKVYPVPESWLLPNEEYAIIDYTERPIANADYHISLYSEGRKMRVDSIKIFPLKKGSFITYEPSKGKKGNKSSTFRYNYTQDNILAKNMNINGVRKFYYPYKDNLYWIRDFSNLTSFVKYGTNDRSLTLAMDAKLIKSVNEAMRESGCVSSSVCLDSDGNVIWLAENKNSRFMLDPNDDEAIGSILEDQYFNPNPATEMAYLANLNLEYLNPGPGSSLKPITYAAVMSQSSPYIDWKNLKIKSPEKLPDESVYLPDGGHWAIKKFGPSYKYPGGWASIKSDETGKNGFVDNNFYLKQSSNYYNATVTYIGQFSEKQLAQGQLFKNARHDDYPIITFNDGQTLYAFKDEPQAESELILYNGLSKNFGIETYSNQLPNSHSTTFLDNNFYNGYDNGKIASLFSYVFPWESKVMDFELRNYNSSMKLRQYTLGSDPIKLTPLKMAELYGKLFSLKGDYSAHLLNESKIFNKQWQNDDCFSLYKETIYSGMESCAKSGTGKVFLDGVNFDSCFVYAKTGTLGAVNYKKKSKNEKTPDNRLFAMVITNKNISSVKNASDYKFFVIYFQFNAVKDKQRIYNTVKRVSKELLGSEYYINYMNI